MLQHHPLNFAAYESFGRLRIGNALPTIHYYSKNKNLQHWRSSAYKPAYKERCKSGQVNRDCADRGEPDVVTAYLYDHCHVLPVGLVIYLLTREKGVVQEP